jgi:hypothetical protein
MIEATPYGKLEVSKYLHLRAVFSDIWPSTPPSPINRKRPLCVHATPGLLAACCHRLFANVE